MHQNVAEPGAATGRCAITRHGHVSSMAENAVELRNPYQPFREDRRCGRHEHSRSGLASLILAHQDIDALP
jgi:hypothetical protein